MKSKFPELWVFGSAFVACGAQKSLKCCRGRFGGWNGRCSKALETARNLGGGCSKCSKSLLLLMKGLLEMRGCHGGSLEMLEMARNCSKSAGAPEGLRATGAYFSGLKSFRSTFPGFGAHVRFPSLEKASSTKVRSQNAVFPKGMDLQIVMSMTHVQFAVTCGACRNFEVQDCFTDCLRSCLMNVLSVDEKGVEPVKPKH